MFVEYYGFSIIIIIVNWSYSSFFFGFFLEFKREQNLAL